MSNADLYVFTIPGIGEITPGTELAETIGIAAEGRIAEGDILAISSKIFSKSEGRIVAAALRESAIESETIRVVATREHPGGVTRIVQNRNGLVLAAAGVDASNTREGTVLLLPEDPDASARRLRAELEQRLGVRLGVLITDTFGRPWRIGQTDVAIGAAGIRVGLELAGSLDAHGRRLSVTHTAVADQIAGAADLVKGKASQCPVAVVRGLSHLVTVEDGPGAIALVRPTQDDMFSLGTREAYTAGYAAGRRAALQEEPNTQGTA